MSQTSFDGKWPLPPPKLKFYKFFQVLVDKLSKPFIASYFPISNQQVPFGHVPNMEMEDTKITQLQEVMGCFTTKPSLSQLLEGKDYQLSIDLVSHVFPGLPPPFKKWLTQFR